MGITPIYMALACMVSRPRHVPFTLLYKQLQCLYLISHIKQWPAYHNPLRIPLRPMRPSPHSHLYHLSSGTRPSLPGSTNLLLSTFHMPNGGVFLKHRSDCAQGYWTPYKGSLWVSEESSRSWALYLMSSLGLLLPTPPGLAPTPSEHA